MVSLAWMPPQKRRILMKHTPLYLYLSAILFLLLGCAQEHEVNLEAETGPSIEGVWTHEEWETIGGPNEGINASPQPSLVFITEDYFSTMFVSSAEPRPLFTSATPSEAEIVEAYNAFVAAAGHYELENSTMVIRPSVALSPNLMSGGSFIMEYKLEGSDTLWLTLKHSDMIIPEIGDPTEYDGYRLKLKRLE
jgi:hypothetical protein